MNAYSALRNQRALAVRPSRVPPQATARAPRAHPPVCAGRLAPPTLRAERGRHNGHELSGIPAAANGALRTPLSRTWATLTPPNGLLLA